MTFRQVVRGALLALLVAVPLHAAEPLRVATSGDYPPFSRRASDGATEGFDLAVARRLAADLGRPLQIEPFRWPDLAALLRAGEIDLAMSGVTARRERALVALFTRPYATTGAVAVVRARDRKRFADLAALDRAEVRLGVNGGGHLEKVARAQFPAARVVTTDDNLALAGLLRDGAVEAVVSEPFEVRTWRGDFVRLGPFTLDRKVYAVPRGKPELAGRVNQWLAAREADGWLDRERSRWFGRRERWGARRACVEAILADIDLRLQIMPWVAAAKQAAGLPVRDPAQEQAVLARVAQQAVAAGLRPAPVQALFEQLMAAAREVQENVPSGTALPENVTLGDLRAAVAAVSDALVGELGRCAPVARPGLASAVRSRVTAWKLTGPRSEAWATAIAAVRRAP